MTKSNNTKPYFKEDRKLYMKCLTCNIERKRVIFNKDIYEHSKVWWTSCACPKINCKPDLLKIKTTIKKSPRINYDIAEKLKSIYAN